MLRSKTIKMLYRDSSMMINSLKTNSYRQVTIYPKNTPNNIPTYRTNWFN